MNENTAAMKFDAIINALKDVNARIARPGWADEFCATAVTRGADLSGFVGTEFDALLDVGQNDDVQRLQQEVQRNLNAIQPRFKLAILTMARDEGLNLAEWVAHSLSVGAEHIFAYTNDNKDGTDDLLHWFRDNAPVSPIFTTVAPGVNIQRKNYRHALYLLPELRLYEWVLVIDVDEFVIPAEKYDFNFINLLKAAPEDADGIVLPWLWRLWEPTIEREEELLCKRYPHAVKHVLFKSAMRLKNTKALDEVHIPTLDEFGRLYDSNFQPIAREDVWSKQPKSYEGGWIDHYWGRSFEEFLVKKTRGDALEIQTGQFKRDYKFYFSWTQPVTESNKSDVSPMVVARMKPLLQKFKENQSFGKIVEVVEVKYRDHRAAIDSDIERVFETIRKESSSLQSDGVNQVLGVPDKEGLDAPEKKEFGNYLINHYRKNTNDVIIVFASAGKDGLGEPIEEFKASLDNFGASMIFIIDRQPKWYNHKETPDAFNYVASLASAYQHVAVLGESMGASGALLFSEFCSTIDRILALAPQYSVAEPFILFDARFAPFGLANPKQLFWTFAPRSAIPKVQILYGNRDWLDAVHASMFAIEGFPVHFVDGAGQLVAKHLKKSGTYNRLYDLLKSFLDFSKPFEGSVVGGVLGSMATKVSVDPDFGFASEKSRNAIYAANGSVPKRLPPPENAVDLVQGGVTNQSSISPWSYGRTTEEDSAGAVSNKIRGPFAFHTALEDRPWWSIDFGQIKLINEIRIYNRIDNATCASRGLNFSIEVSGIDNDWEEVFRKTDSVMFGGADGKPFIWKPTEPILSRHLRIRLLERNCLHYDKIEIFGR